MRIFILFAAASLALTGCSKTVTLRYEPQVQEAVPVAKGPIKVFVEVDKDDLVALRTSRGGGLNDPIDFAEPFPTVLKRSLETQMTFLGVSTIAAKGEADAVLTASELSLQCITGVISAAELRFALKLENSKGDVLMDGRIHAAAGSGSWWRCTAASGALANAMAQVGGLLDASDALAVLQHGRIAPPSPSGIAFPLAAGARPKVYIFPPEDRIGMIYNDNNGVDPVLPYYGDAAHPFAVVLRAALAAHDLPVTDKKADADWILKMSLVSAHAVLHYVGFAQNASIKLWYKLRLEDRSGAVLWEDVLEGSGRWNGTGATEGKVSPTVTNSMDQVAGQLGTFLKGERSDAEPVYVSAAPARSSGDGGGVDESGAFRIVSGLLGAFVPGLSNLTGRIPGASNLRNLSIRVPGGARVERLVHKAEKIKDAVQQAEDVIDDVTPQDGAAPAGSPADDQPAAAPVPAASPSPK